MMTDLEWTGERYLPEVGGEIGLEHIHRYFLAAPFASNKIVLDIACGEGYGSAILAKNAKQVIGVDVSLSTISHANAKYAAPNLDYLVGSCAAVPLEDASIDLIVSFETIEHHDQHDEMLRECKRILKPDGVLIMSSPDRLEYSEIPGYDNPFHVKELTTNEFRELVCRYFDHVQLYGQRLHYGSLVGPIDDRQTKMTTFECRDGDVKDVFGLAHPVYVICIASKELLQETLVSGICWSPVIKCREGDQEQGTDKGHNELENEVVEMQLSIQQLKSTIKLREETIEDLRRRMIHETDSLSGRIASLESALAEKERDTEFLRVQVDKLAGRLDLMTSSKSWRLTAPLRMSADLVRLSCNDRTQLRPYVAQMARRLWGSLSLSGRNKAKVKTVIFVAFRPFVANTGAYKRWKSNRLAQISTSVAGKAIESAPVRGRVLLIDRRYPEPDKDAGSVTTYSVLRLLREIGYQVSFIPDDLNCIPESISVLQSLGVECLHHGDIDSVGSYLSHHGHDIAAVFLFRCHVAANYLPLVRQYCPTAKVILNTSDLHYLRESRWAEVEASDERRIAADHTRQFEQDIIAKCDISIVMSEFERALLQADLPLGKIALVPLYFVDICDSEVPFSARNGICFVGGYEHAPNIDAVEYFCRDIFPLIRQQIPDIEFFILGSNPTAAVHALGDIPGVRVVGYVADLSEHMRNVRLSVAPLRFGAGIKGKIISSLASGVPCVATAIAAEGMALSHGHDVLVGSSPAEFAELVIRAYTDQDLWTHLSKSGIEYCRQYFSYDAGRVSLSSLMLGIGVFPPEKHPNTDLIFTAISSFSDYKRWADGGAAVRMGRKNTEDRLIGDAGACVRVPGFCWVCNSPTGFLVDMQFSLSTYDGQRLPNLRERLVCEKCSLNNRMRAAVHALEVICRPARESVVYITEQITEMYRVLGGRFPFLVGSEFLGDDIPYGTVEPNGIRNETLEHLTFGSESFDYVVSFDVFEHVPNYRSALKECFRCLKPGGTLFFTVPFVLDSESNLIRARMASDGSVEHILEPEYHGDPLRSEGVLCFQHFGWELMRDLRSCGFESAAVHFYWSDYYGYMGGDQFVITATKG